MNIGADAERQYIRAIFGALGASEAERNALAEVLTEADLRGYSSHGFIRIASNATMMKNGDLDRGAEPRILRETGPTAVIDGARTNGPYAATFAARDAVQRARAHGIGAVALQECGHLGIAGYYVELMAREGLVGLLFAKSESSVHPHGGLERLLGTNPVAIAIPREPHPLLLDMSTSAIAAGRVRDAARAGLSIPEGSAIDAEGSLTTDPQAALAGALSAMGGPKGYGLSLAIEILGGLLVGGASGPMTPTDGRRQLYAALIIAIDPSAFVEPARFKVSVARFLTQIKASRKAPGFNEILVPGERSFRTRQERLDVGIPIEDEVWEQVADIARGLGINPDDYRTAP